MSGSKITDFDKGNGDGAPGESEFDLSILAELNEDIGPETFADLVSKCIEDVEVRLARLSAEPSPAADGSATRAIAHQLKGLFLQFGARAATADAAALEKATPTDAADKIEELKLSAARAQAFFKRLLNGN